MQAEPLEGDEITRKREEYSEWMRTNNAGVSMNKNWPNGSEDNTNDLREAGVDTDLAEWLENQLEMFEGLGAEIESQPFIFELRAY